MKSMTGYGKAEAVKEGRCLTVELKSVNHRFLDLGFRLPRIFIAYEDLFRNIISEGVTRGHVDVFVNYSDTTDRPKRVNIDMGLAKGLLSAAETLQREFDLKNDFQLNSLLKTNDIISVEQEEDNPEILKDLIREAAFSAAENLNKMRQAEGEKIKNTLISLVDNIENLVSQINSIAPVVVSDYRNKLTERIKEALDSVSLDEAKLANEVAFFADKANIDEEVARLNSHISQIRSIMDLSEATGRKLDFLVQEFNREANTICSKSNNLQLTNLALQLKNEVEKVREQVQNIE
jgi:uncharacterized protein (TIGR00255 family)